MHYLNLKSLFMLDITQIKFCKYYQGVTKMVSTCPRQVVLISGQVGYQTYLSFGRVNPRVFASVKQITFHESNLQVRIEKKKTALMQVTYNLSAISFHCALKGAWHSWGDRLLHFLIDPLGNC